ncbi:MAG: LysR family transcriptional regulator [Haliea sp.]
MDREQNIYPSLRALRRAMVVGDMQHLTHAAHALRRSQSAITRSIAGLEKFLGVQLFERTVTGMLKTSAGEVLFRRVRNAVDHMARAEVELAARPTGVSHLPNSLSFLRFEVSNTAIFLFLSICDHRDFRRAAASSGIAVSTARKSIHGLERQLGVPLFEREPRNAVRPSKFAEIIARHTKRALWEVRAGLDELRALDGSIGGKIRIGVMSTARSSVVPQAVDRLRRAHSDVLVSVFWANYDDLKYALSCGDIDFIVGTLRDDDVDAADIHVERLVHDVIEVVSSAQHPMAGVEEVSLKDLLDLDWILPPDYFPLRIWFRKLLHAHGLSEPKPFIETASLAILRGVLLESDCVALSTRLQCWYDTVKHGLMRVVPVRELKDPGPFYLHMSKRKDAEMSPAAEVLYRMVADVSKHLKERALSAESQAVAQVPEKS